MLTLSALAHRAGAEAGKRALRVGDIVDGMLKKTKPWQHTGSAAIRGVQVQQQGGAALPIRDKHVDGTLGRIAEPWCTIQTLTEC